MTEQRLPQPHDYAFWGPYAVLFGITALIVLHFTLSSLVISLSDPDGNSAWNQIFSVSLQLSFLAVAWLFGPGLIRSTLKQRISSLGFRKINKYKLTCYSLVTLLGSMALSSIALFVISGLGLDDIPTHLPQELTTTNLILTFTLLVLLTPIAEEVFFRGFIVSGLKVSWGVWPAAIASSTIFSLMHGSIALVVPTFLSGLVLTWSLENSRSLWPGVLAIWPRTRFILELW